MTFKHILVAEDEHHMRHTLSLILKKAGYSATNTADGYEALKILLDTEDGASPVDLLLTDIEMPGLTGIELVEELRRFNIALPILFITGIRDWDAVKRLKAEGFVESIAKPFDADDLLKRVSDIFKKDGLNKKNEPIGCG